LPVEGGRGERIDMGKEALLADFLDDLPSNEPVVVFCRFRSDLDCVRQAAATLRRRYGELSGQRRDLTEHAMMRDDVDVMGVQIQSGGVGVDFTRAAYAVYFSVNWALGDYDQSLARLHRPGQNRPVRYYHLLARDTVDEKVYKAFDTKREIIETVLSSLSGRYAA
jgi:SNF2 family DNA or RNA helicase